MRNFRWYESDSPRVDLLLSFALDLDNKGTVENKHNLLRARMHVPGRADARCHLQKIDHGLLDCLVLARQVGLQELRELQRSLRRLSVGDAHGRWQHERSARDIQEPTANEHHDSILSVAYQ